MAAVAAFPWLRTLWPHTSARVPGAVLPHLPLRRLRCDLPSPLLNAPLGPLSPGTGPRFSPHFDVRAERLQPVCALSPRCAFSGDPPWPGQHGSSARDTSGLLGAGFWARFSVSCPAAPQQCWGHPVPSAGSLCSGLQDSALSGPLPAALALLSPVPLPGAWMSLPALLAPR